MDKTIKWILALGALVYAGRAVRDAYVGNLTDAAVTLGDLEGILGQRGRARRLYFDEYGAGGVRTNPTDSPCPECEEAPGAGCCG